MGLKKCKTLVIYIVPLDPAHKAGPAGHVPADILEHYT